MTVFIDNEIVSTDLTNSIMTTVHVSRRTLVLATTLVTRYSTLVLAQHMRKFLLKFLVSNYIASDYYILFSSIDHLDDLK